MATEQELLHQIEKNNGELKEARLLVSTLKEKLMDAETVLIGLKLKEDKLQDTLRRLQNASLKPSEYDEAFDEDIERFRKKLPDLMDKIK